MRAPLASVLAAVGPACAARRGVIDELTLEACEQAVAVMKRPALGMWVERWFERFAGGEAAIHARRLGVLPARGTIDEKARRWEPEWCPAMGPERIAVRSGDVALSVTVWVVAPECIGGWSAVDMIAWDPDNVSRWGALRQATDVLGMAAARGALIDGERIAIHRSPASWCAAGGDAVGATVDGGEDEPATRVCVLDWDSADAKSVLTEAVELVCEDVEHAEAIDRALTSLRKRWLPKRPALSVREARSAAA